MIATFKKKGWMKLYDTHWEVYDSAFDESSSTDDEECHHHGNEVHEEEYVQQSKIYILVRNETSGNR